MTSLIQVDEENQGGYCRGAPDQIITGGDPIATFKWDYVTNVDFKNFSVREIQVPLVSQ